MSDLGDALAFHVRVEQLAEPVRELKFHPTRKWKFDLAWPAQKVAAECDGGTWVKGRHSRGSGYEKDCEKLNAAVEMGWKVYRFTTNMIDDGRAIDTLRKVLA
jgi:very-short-patch-repair endonuclease